MDFKKLANQYKDELLDNVLPFWLENSQDHEYGGYFTCLDREGRVFDTDKFIWLQGREVWMFSMLYNKVEKRKEWLDCAVQGGEFLKKYGHDGDYNWYFSLDRLGRPLVEPYNIFSYTFAAMAFGQLSLATGNQEYADIAKKTFDIILSKVDNPKGKWNKLHPGTRNLKNFALPMILCNLAMEIEHILGKDYLEQAMDTCIHEVMSVFYRPELGGIIVENVDVNGNLIDCFEGRQITPGHAIEAMWFIMDLGKRLNRPELIEKAKNITLTMLEYGWDKEYGGIYYFMDRFAEELNQADEVYLCHFPENAAREDGIDITISDLADKCEKATVINEDEEAARMLAQRGPAVYLFMSSKDIYKLKNIVKTFQ